MAIDIYATHYIRWMINRDVEEVLEIDRHSFCDPWTRDELTSLLRYRNCIGMVIEIKDKTVGFMTYELHNTHFNVLRLAVHEDHRFEKFGTKLIDKLKSKLAEDRRKHIEMVVHEEQLEAQVFLRANGFICTRVIRNYYMHGESAYFFQFSI